MKLMQNDANLKHPAWYFKSQKSDLFSLNLFPQMWNREIKFMSTIIFPPSSSTSCEIEQENCCVCFHFIKHEYKSEWAGDEE
jgi:hypothetical protein